MRSHRKTKILVTLGPSSNSQKTIQKLVAAGANAFRLNLAHGNHKDHGKLIRYLRTKVKKPVAIVADIPGPKIRVGNLPPQGVLLETDSRVTLDTRASTYRNGRIPVPMKPVKIKKGNIIFLDDGMIMLRVRNASSKILCDVIHGGRLFSRKGVNVPGMKINPNKELKKDKAHILFAKKAGVDYISLSFISKAEDVRHTRSLLDKKTKIIAKIESKEAIENLDEILNTVDAVMIARGDLGLETPLTEVPIRQKEIIDKCHKIGVPVIVATQMLASMVKSIVPTRAEISDVANAVLDSADVLMLSGETANGAYPVGAVRTMRQIIHATEGRSPRNLFHETSERVPINIAVAEAATRAAEDVHAKFILVSTTSGASAIAVAKYRPSVPIIAITHDAYVERQLALVWGIRSFSIPRAKSVSDLLKAAVKTLKKEKSLRKGNAVVHVSGIKFHDIGGTNNMRIVVV